MLLVLLILVHLSAASAVDFVFDSFTVSDDLTLVGDARFNGDAAVIRLTNDSNQFSFGRAFYPSPLPMLKTLNSSANVSSFSTSFVFSVLPEIPTSPGFGLTFVLSNSTSPAGAIAGQYFGVFTNATVRAVAPLLAVEFDAGRNPEFNDPDGNHVGIDLNNIESAATQTAGYYDSSSLVPVDMRNGQNIRVWIEFDGTELEFNVTIAPIGVPRPSRPLLTYKNPAIANYLSNSMYVGFSASKTTWVEAQRILAWSLSDTGRPAREINTTNLPIFLPKSSNSSLSAGAIAGISVASVLFAVLCFSGLVWYWRRKTKSQEEEDDDVEEWELEYWPHRFSYEELTKATSGFSDILGSGGFGKVYRGILPNNTEIAVKCVNHDSKQGLREFMAEISSIGRLQHKNLVQMRGWCRKSNELMLIYDYMPHGSLNRWIFDNPKTMMAWPQRRRVLSDVAEGLCYLHHGWDQVVLHRDIKSSNILIDSEMRGRVGDFGLAKLYGQGEAAAPGTTRLVGTLGYLAPELAAAAAPTAASDVYGFGVVVLEVACGRRPIEAWREAEEEQVIVDWVRGLYREGRLKEAADRRIVAAAEMEIEMEVEAVLKLGLACCHPDPRRRPTMMEVATVLLGDEAAAVGGAVAVTGLTVAGGGGIAVDEDHVSGEEEAPLSHSLV